MKDWEIDLLITIILFAAAIIDAETDVTFNFMEMETVMEMDCSQESEK